MVEDAKDLWSISNYDLKVLVRNEYHNEVSSDYPRA